MDSFSSALFQGLISENREEFVIKLTEKCKDILKENPDNRCAKYALEYVSSEEIKLFSNEGKRNFSFILYLQ